MKAEELDRVLDTGAMTRPGIPGKGKKGTGKKGHGRH